MNPYLSVVVTSRNDNHGGSLLYRMQHFVDGLIIQCNRHKLKAELIIVEWNPPEENPPLVKALQFPKGNHFCKIRFIRVSKEIHMTLDHADKIPLFQMIGKNIGIRRALGKFVLATNIDILFSNELIEHIKTKLKSGRVYRVDRLDVPNELPRSNSFDEILQYCKINVLRANTKFGTAGVRKSLLKKIREYKIQVYLRIGFLQLISKIKSSIARNVIIPVKKSYSPNPFAFTRNLIVKLFNKIIYVCLNSRFFAYNIESFILRNVIIPVKKSYYLNPITFTRNLFINILNKIVYSIPNKPVFKKTNLLHTNACGDFTLLSIVDWNNLKGYPEWNTFSWHLDSILLFQANHNGLKEVVLSKKKVIYHIDHSSGYSPEGAEELFRRLDSKKIPYLTNQTLAQIVSEMKNFEGKVVYNGENWGMADRFLEEIEIN